MNCGKRRHKFQRFIVPMIVVGMGPLTLESSRTLHANRQWLPIGLGHVLHEFGITASASRLYNEHRDQIHRARGKNGIAQCGATARRGNKEHHVNRNGLP